MKRAGTGQQAVSIRNIKTFLSVAFCVLAIAYSLSGCGRKGDPRAPELAMPEPIKDLKAEAQARGIALTWSRPARYVDGKSLRDLGGFVIFRKEISRTCPECPVPYRERARVNVEDQGKFIKKREFRFVDQELSPRTVYRYRILSRLLDDSLSDPSNEAEVAWRP